MADLVVEIDSRKLREGIRRYPKLAFANLKSALRRSLGAFRREFLRDLEQRIGPGRGGRHSLAKSFRWEVTGSTINTLVGSFYTDSRAALGFEVGETVRPNRGSRYIAIPIGASLGPGGRAKPSKKTAKEVIPALKAKGKIRYVKRGDHIIVYEKKGASKKAGRRAVGQFSPIRAKIRGRGFKSGGRMFPIFLLVKQVKIKRILQLFDSWADFGPERQKRLGEALEATLAGRRVA